MDNICLLYITQLYCMCLGFIMKTYRWCLNLHFYGFLPVGGYSLMYFSSYIHKFKRNKLLLMLTFFDTENVFFCHCLSPILDSIFIIQENELPLCNQIMNIITDIIYIIIKLYLWTVFKVTKAIQKALKREKFLFLLSIN